MYSGYAVSSRVRVPCRALVEMDCSEQSNSRTVVHTIKYSFAMNARNGRLWCDKQGVRSKFISTNFIQSHLGRVKLSKTLDHIEREVASEVLDVVVSEAMVIAPAAEHRDECLAFLHTVLRNTHLRYGAMPLQNLESQMSSAFGPRGGLSATPLMITHVDTA